MGTLGQEEGTRLLLGLCPILSPSLAKIHSVVFGKAMVKDDQTSKQTTVEETDPVY